MILFALGMINTLQAQSLKRQVISSAGNRATANNLVVTSTIGETFTNTLSSASLKVKQGFQQGNITVLRMMNEEHSGVASDENATSEKTGSTEPESNFKISVYPNPATDYVNVKVNELPESKCIMFLYDATGRTIEVQEIGDTETRINFERLNTGNYFLTVKSEDGKVKESFQVIKK